jgi:hypothetical protein
MPDFVKQIPQDDLALFIALLAVAAVSFGVFVVKPILRLFIGRGDPTINEAIGYGTQSFSLFYALLVGLLTVAAYQNKERVEQAILAEAAAVGTLYSAMDSYPEPLRSEVKSMLRDYVLFTVHKDWPAHRQGEILDGGSNRANAMRQRLAGFEPANVSQEIVHRETFRAFQDFGAARQLRLNGVITRIPAVLWYAVLVGAVINLLILILFRIRLVAHLVLGTISAFFLGVVLFVIVVLDDPLKGDSGLPPMPFEQLWDRQMVWDEPLQ